MFKQTLQQREPHFTEAWSLHAKNLEIQWSINSQSKYLAFLECTPLIAPPKYTIIIKQTYPYIPIKKIVLVLEGFDASNISEQSVYLWVQFKFNVNSLRLTWISCSRTSKFQEVPSMSIYLNPLTLHHAILIRELGVVEKVYTNIDEGHHFSW